MKCEEVPELKPDDGATRIFLNTRGKHPELVSPELIELLKYMEHSTDEVSEACECIDEFVRLEQVKRQR